MVRRLFFVLSLLFLSHTAFSATLAEYSFETSQQDEDFRAIIEEMRCLVCQNESLAGSNAELAVDLRNKIYDMMQAGQGKDQIIDFMVARYGDFVLYSPPVKPSTYPLWFGPILLFIIGAVVLLTILRKKNRSRETELSTEEQQRLDNLLKQSTDSRNADQ
ncbi:MAG: cytochrome c-type biogenesis protein CcmH [Candidatus Thiodiazotropha sp. (ex Gloverina cf. vestifex)]|nr:cytochrome c-type biogenesis protein CcmH [Candidatus Thiodiazotropha sp. (ex Gloverina cf. vestifex)]